MKHSLVLVLLLPLHLLSQEIECIDTVIIGGYFYKENRRNYTIKKIVRDGLENIFFIPEDDAEARGGLLKALVYRKDREIAESDTVGFCPYKPHRYIYEPDSGIIKSIQPSCKQLLARCITPNPFTKRNEFFNIYSYEHPVIVTYATVKWLKLKVKSEIATYAKQYCGGSNNYYEGFDPNALLLRGWESRYFTIFVAMEILEVDPAIPFTNKRPALTMHMAVILPKRVL